MTISEFEGIISGRNVKKMKLVIFPILVFLTFVLLARAAGEISTVSGVAVVDSTQYNLEGTSFLIIPDPADDGNEETIDYWNLHHLFFQQHLASGYTEEYNQWIQLTCTNGANTISLHPNSDFQIDLPPLECTHQMNVWNSSYGYVESYITYVVTYSTSTASSSQQTIYSGFTAGEIALFVLIFCEFSVLCVLSYHVMFRKIKIKNQ